jgi:PAS domain S-box-containing protein
MPDRNERTEGLALAALDVLDCAVAVVDEGGVIVLANEMWRQLLGCAPGVGPVAESSSYLAACRASAHPRAATVIAAVEEQLAEGGAPIAIDYTESRAEEPRPRWLTLRVASLGRRGRVALMLHDDSPRRWAEQATLGHNRVLEAIARGDRLEGVLEELVRFVEDQVPGSRCSVLLRRGDVLRQCAGAHIPAGYVEELGDVPIGPGIGCCGTAAHRAEPVIVADIDTDPLWAAFRHLAAKYELRSCWSVPLLASGTRRVLGTFALYRSVPGNPSDEIMRALLHGAHLAGVAIERARAMDDLRESEESFRLLVDGIPDAAVFMLDPAGNVATWSHAAQRHYGYGTKQAIGLSASALEADPNASAALAAPGPTESLQRRSTGQTFWANVVTTPLHDDDGALRGYARVVRDLTTQRSLEEQLRHAQKMEAVGRLAGGIAHDFNNLLTVIAANAELIAVELEGGDPGLVEAAGEVVSAAARAAGLTQQLLAFSRKQVLEPVVVDLNRIVADCEKLLTRLIGEDVRLQSRLAEDLWLVKADPGQLEQVLVNLCVNARDAMAQGGLLTISTRNVESAVTGEGRSVELSVADTGCGMDEATRARVFEPFFTTKPPGKGTGLGLAVVYGIVRQSGGVVEVDSAPGAGTRITVRLPVCTEAPRPRLSSGLELCAVRGNETIFVVEDEEPVRAVLARALTMHGYTVIQAGSGDEAVERLASLDMPIDLLVTDVVMPGIAGTELVAELRSRSIDPPVLFVSGYAEDAQRIAASGPRTSFLQKPFTPRVLLERVRAALASSRAAVGR